MGKWFGTIGFDLGTVETAPGVWTQQIAERQYYGDIQRNYRALQAADKVNDDINVSNEISIVSDPYANENFCNIRYVIFMNAKWRVTGVEVHYPRLILTLGGVWNEH